MIKFIDSIKKWLFGVFEDTAGRPSSKRIVGVACGACLCICLFLEKAPDQHIIDAVALLAFGCLGLSSIDKISETKTKIKEILGGVIPDPVAVPVTPTEVAIEEDCICPAGCQCGNCEKCFHEKYSE